jgi:hypothetical protein
MNSINRENFSHSHGGRMPTGPAVPGMNCIGLCAPFGLNYIDSVARLDEIDRAQNASIDAIAKVGLPHPAIETLPT